MKICIYMFNKKTLSVYIKPTMYEGISAYAWKQLALSANYPRQILYHTHSYFSTSLAMYAEIFTYSLIRKDAKATPNDQSQKYLSELSMTISFLLIFVLDRCKYGR